MDEEKLRTLKKILLDTLDENTIKHRIKLRAEVVKWIKKIRLAKRWRSHQLSGNSGSCMWRNKIPKPKEEMSEKEINYYLQFGGLCDDIPCNILKVLCNLTEEDLK